jgi:hypothetical protein
MLVDGLRNDLQQLGHRGLHLRRLGSDDFLCHHTPDLLEAG